MLKILTIHIYYESSTKYETKKWMTSNFLTKFTYLVNIWHWIDQNVSASLLISHNGFLQPISLTLQSLTVSARTWIFFQSRFDMMIRVFAENLEALHTVVIEKIGKIEGIQNTETFVELQKTDKDPVYLTKS